MAGKTLHTKKKMTTQRKNMKPELIVKLNPNDQSEFILVELHQDGTEYIVTGGPEWHCINWMKVMQDLDCSVIEFCER